MDALEAERDRLKAVNAELLEAVEQSYVILGGISNQWTGRHTIHGQSVLVNLRDAICAATGREAQEVQDDYCNRAALAKARGQ